MASGRALPPLGFIVTDPRARTEKAVRFYNQRGGRGNHGRKGECALAWARFSSPRFASKQVRLALFAPGYKPGNLPRRLALPGEMSLRSLRGTQPKRIEIGARTVNHARRAVSRMAEETVTGGIFAEALARTRSPAPVPAWGGERRKEAHMEQAAGAQGSPDTAPGGVSIPYRGRVSRGGEEAGLGQVSTCPLGG